MRGHIHIEMGHNELIDKHLRSAWDTPTTEYAVAFETN